MRIPRDTIAIASDVCVLSEETLEAGQVLEEYEEYEEGMSDCVHLPPVTLMLLAGCRPALAVQTFAN